MILATILIIILALLAIAGVAILSVGGTAFIVVFADVIVCALFVFWIIKRLFKRR